MTRNLIRCFNGAVPVTAEQLKARNAKIAEAQRRAWRDPEIRARRSAAIARAWDEPLRRAIMSRIKSNSINDVD